MAGNDTAALVVALSAQLTKFEKDMKGAVDIANRRTKEIENSFTKLNAEINNQLSNLATGFAARLGPIGAVLRSIGPAGLAIAAPIGAAAAAFLFFGNKVDEFADKSKRLKEAAETAGLTANEFKALSQAGVKVGLDFEQSEKFIDRLTVATEDLVTKGSGPLFDVLQRLRPELNLQIAAASDTAERISILAAAYKELATAGEKAQFAAAIGGKRNIAGGRLLEALPTGGVQELVDNLLKAGKAVDPDLTDKVIKLKNEIEAIHKQTDNIWGRTFAPEILTASKVLAEIWLAIALNVERTNKGANKSGGFLDSVVRGAQRVQQSGPFVLARQKLAAPTTAVEEGQPLPPAVDRAVEAHNKQLAVELEQLSRKITILGSAATAAELYRQKELQIAVAVSANKDATNEGTRALTAFQAQQNLELINARISALGGAATQTELLNQRQTQLNNAVQLDSRLTNEATRGLEEYKRQQQQTVEATRERLGIAGEFQIVQSRLNQLAADAKVLGLNENEVLRATNVILKESKETADQLAIRRSYFPGLTQLAIDAGHVDKAFDQLATHAFDTLGDGLADIVLKTKTVSEAFKSMTDSILRDLLKLAQRQLTGSVLGLLGFGGGGLTGGSLRSVEDAGWFAPMSAGTIIGKAAAGGSFRSGDWSTVGERGPELVRFGTDAKVIPNDVFSRSAGGGGIPQIIVNNYNANDTETRQSGGLNGEAIIIDVVKRHTARGTFDDSNRGRFGLRAAKVR